MDLKFFDAVAIQLLNKYIHFSFGKYMKNKFLIIFLD